MFATFSTKEVSQDILNSFRQGRHFDEYFDDKGKSNVTLSLLELDVIVNRAQDFRQK
jgi:hypothetical protein